MMKLREETSLADLTMPVAAFQDHLRLGSGFSETSLQIPVLEGFLTAAFAAIEGQTGKILLQRDYSCEFDQWRDGVVQPLPIAPVTEVLSATFVDADGQETLIDPARYRLRADDHRPELVAHHGCLPQPISGSTILLRLRAGMAATFEALPRDIAQAVLLLAAHYYEHRTATDLPTAHMPFGVAHLIERYKSVRLFAGRVS